MAFATQPYINATCFERPLPTKVRTAIHYAAGVSPFYRARFSALHLSASDIRTYSAFEKLKPTEKREIAADYRKFVCVPERAIIDRSCTSGTSGAPVPFVLSENDLLRLTNNEATALRIAGITADDTVQLCTTMDHRFMAGLAYFMGLRSIGASVIRQGVGTIAGQWETVLRERPTAIICVPSFLLKMIQYAEENGIKYQTSSLRKAVCVGERIRQQNFQLNALGQRIVAQWESLQLYGTYASTEMGAAFTECDYGCGGHHNPDLIHIEVVDTNGRAVKPGVPGELLVTTLGVEAMPLLRFRTGDIVTAHHEACRCGRTSLRVGPVIGRLNQLLKVKGTSIYVPAVQDLLNKERDVEDYVIEASSSPEGQDKLRIYYSIKIGSLQTDLARGLSERCRARLRMRPDFVRMTGTEIRKMRHSGGSRKPKVFIDNRVKLIK